MQAFSISLDKAQELLALKQFSTLRAILSAVEPADIAEFLSGIPEEQFPVVFRILPKDLAACVFIEMDSDQQKTLIDTFTDTELRAMLDELFVDDTVDLIEEMPANVVERILLNSHPDTRRMINEILKYPDDSAGSIMTTEYVGLKQTMTVEQAFDIIRRVAIDKETIYTCYVTDANRKLIGVVTAKTLLISQKDAIIQDIMDSSVIFARTLDNKEDVTLLFDKYNFLAVPVVDKEDRLVGIITVDDAIDVIHEATEEDFAKMAAITPNEKEYLRTSPLEIWKDRIPWLILMMLSSTFTGLIITSFENKLSGLLALTAFIPMLMGTGGNSGSQASVTVIRGLSLGEINFRDVFRVLWKETCVALLCGVTLAVVCIGKVMLIDNLLLHTEGVNLLVAVTIGLTLAVTVVCSKIIGCCLPLLAKKLGFDPAVMAAPFITTLVDAVSLLVYFSFASALLGL